MPAKKKTAARLDHEIEEALTDAPSTKKSRPWQGVHFNEGLVNRARAGLIGIYLDGVASVSPVIEDYGYRQVPPNKADVYLQKGREVLTNLTSQRVPASMKRWYMRTVAELRDLIKKASAVRDGITSQKMTAKSYEKLHRSLSSR